MVAKLVLGMVVLAIVLLAVVGAAFLYFKQTAELKHEKEMERLERDEKLFDSEFGQQDSIDRELEREK